MSSSSSSSAGAVPEGALDSAQPHIGAGTMLLLFFRVPPPRREDNERWCFPRFDRPADEELCRLAGRESSSPPSRCPWLALKEEGVLVDKTLLSPAAGVSWSSSVSSDSSESLSSGGAVAVDTLTLVEVDVDISCLLDGGGDGEGEGELRESRE